MTFTDVFIRKPVLATVVSLLILVFGLQAVSKLPIREYPDMKNAVITVSTGYIGADPELIAGFITTPLENAIAQANGIDYLTSSSTQNVSMIKANLKLDYDPDKALTEISTKVNSILNQLPRESQKPIINLSIGDSVASMYIGFYSTELASNQITDYLIRVVQPKLQTVSGVQQAQILGARQFAMRIWLDPQKLASYSITTKDVAQALANNDVISAVGRTKGNMITVNLVAETGLHSVDEFEKLIIFSQGGAFVRLKDVANVTLGSDDYTSAVSFDGKEAVYVGIEVAPNANLLTVIDRVKAIFPEIQSQFPIGLNGKIIYDATKFVNSSIDEVIKSLLDALIIVSLVVFLFLGTIRSVIIPVVAIPLSLVGAFFIMYLLGYSINLLTLLALVLSIGLVVDDAIIIVENIYRHMEDGKSGFDAAIQGARELASPIIGISLVLVAVYLPIGFMGGLTGTLFSEFAFTLAGAVAVSAVVALTLSPMMCAKYMRSKKESTNKFSLYIDDKFEQLSLSYQKKLHSTLHYVPVVAVFSIIILVGIYYLYSTSKKELAPQEDKGIIISILSTQPNATLQQTQLYSKQVYDTFAEYPETEHVFQIDGMSGVNSSIAGMVLKPWEERQKTTMVLQPEIQQKLTHIAGARAISFQPPPLPGSGGGLPIQFVIGTTDPFPQLNRVTENFTQKVKESGIFMFFDSDLKIDKLQISVDFDREKASQLGLTMKDISDTLVFGLGGNYTNYFSMAGRSYKVIPQFERAERLNFEQLLGYYITAANGMSVPLSTVAHVKRKVVPESLNHFQQLNAATISGVPLPGVTMGEALNSLKLIADEVLPNGYSVDYAGQSRQYIQEGNALLYIFFFALVIIFLCLAALFESFRDPLIILVSVPMSIFGALLFINLGVGGASLNIYTQVGLVTLIGLISKHGILIVQFANELQLLGHAKRTAVEQAAAIRLRPILMTTAATVLGVLPLLFATGAGAASRFNIGLVIATGIAIGTFFTLFVLPAIYVLIAEDHTKIA